MIAYPASGLSHFWEQISKNGIANHQNWQHLDKLNASKLTGNVHKPILFAKLPGQGSNGRAHSMSPCCPGLALQPPHSPQPHVNKSPLPLCIQLNWVRHLVIHLLVHQDQNFINRQVYWKSLIAIPNTHTPHQIPRDPGRRQWLGPQRHLAVA